MTPEGLLGPNNGRLLEIHESQGAMKGAETAVAVQSVSVCVFVCDEATASLNAV